MTITEILKAQGLDEQAVQQVLDAMKANKIYTASEENLDIRYGKLKSQQESTAGQLSEAQKLIEQLKQQTAEQEGLKGKATEYEARIAKMQQELEQTKLDAALRYALQASRAVDPDYMIYKLKEKGELSLDDDGRIKGWDDKLAGLKVQFPTQFEGEGKRTVIVNKLPEQQEENSSAPASLADALKMAYTNKEQ